MSRRRPAPARLRASCAGGDARIPLVAAAYPFTALVGQEEMRLALLLAAIDPGIGGVLIFGHRGTGKSTAVRALAELLTRQRVVKNCPFGCDPAGPCEACLRAGRRTSGQRRVPVVDLPLGATEDRVCGSLDVGKALAEGVKAFEPGLLAKANRGFLYIDEVNLLEDYLVDLLLDVAASGINVVEREGISVRHPAGFVLVGSGNPEEGELRPQLLDRFGLAAEIGTIADPDQRVEIVLRRQAFDRDAEGFTRRWTSKQETLRRKIRQAQQLLPAVELPPELLRRIAELCAKLEIHGHRGELTIARAATALAALRARPAVTLAEARDVASLALRHRLRRDPLESVEAIPRIQLAVDNVLAA
ncbi:MAG: magnesium chelatase ATPase subunit I [Chloroflexota bacterium]|nr:magnesium chelatase ATPase subunit I [Chloroflexota bacterium]